MENDQIADIFSEVTYPEKVRVWLEIARQTKRLISKQLNGQLLSQKLSTGDWDHQPTTDKVKIRI